MNRDQVTEAVRKKTGKKPDAKAGRVTGKLEA